MKTNCNKYLAVVLLSLCAMAICRAQTSGTQTCKLKFRLISWDSEISDLQMQNGDGKVAPVRILPNGRSPFYTYEGPGPVAFGRQKSGPDGKPVFEEAVTVPIKEFSERTLLMLAPNPDARGRYFATGFDDTDAALPPGTYRFVNLSPKQLAIKCGDGSGAVAPKEALTLKARTTDNPEIMPVEIWAKSDAGYQRVYSNRWPYGPATRTLVFVYFVPGKKSFELKRIQEDAAALPTPTPKP
jgi:hypothetical protein